MQNSSLYPGLTNVEVGNSRQLHGANVLTPPKKKSAWILFLEKFDDPIIKILLVALILSVGVAIYQFHAGLEGVEVFFEPVGIFIALLMATVIGFVVEQNANKKFEILNQVNDDTQIKVIRDSQIRQVTRKEIVVGDIVILDAGEEVPADGMLLEAVSLQINESTLTGEPIVTKTTYEANFEKEATYPSNEVLRGTTVAGGHGIFRVTNVGDQTEYGKVYAGSQIENNTQTPLNKQLNGLGKLVTIASFTIAAIIVIVRLTLFFVNHPGADLLHAGSYILETLMIAITLIVVSVPEGLPMSIVLSLALSMKRMLATNNLVRKMHACETMGAVTVICTDKTGTLTKNQMQVYKADFPGIENTQVQNLIYEGIAANSTAFLDFNNPAKVCALGNPTEGALLLWLNSRQANYLSLRENARIIEQKPFSTEHKYMATLVDSPLIGKKVLYVKGAPEIVLAHCKQVATAGGLSPVQQQQEKISRQLLGYQQQAMRTLGFAYQIIEDENIHPESNGLEDTNLIFAGIVAISDPVREEVPEAIQQCMAAGINVKIVTGDTPATATEIARQIGLWLPTDTAENHITGPEFASLTDEELLGRIQEIKIISRARPMDKERLVKLLQQQEEVVAVTGDGTNDAPALNAAQVGLSMGDGTTVAKEASSITILDNSFHSITRAVMWGRSLYQNIQRFILFQLTVNVVACLIILFGAFLGTESPLTITQMLWVNLIMDTFAALALASLPPNEKVMACKPRTNKEFIITKEMALKISGTSILFVVLLVGLLQYFKYYNITGLTQFSFRDFFTGFFRTGHIPHALTHYELTIFFTIFIMFQFWNLLNTKAFATTKPILRNIPASKVFWVVAFIIFAGQILIVNFGGQMFNVQALPATDWLYIILATSSVLWCGELFRLVKQRISSK